MARTTRTPTGTIIVEDDTEELRLVQLWAEAARRNERAGQKSVLSFTVHSSAVRGGTPPNGDFKPGSVSLFRDHGYRPELFHAVLLGEGGVHEALEYLVNQKPGTEMRPGTITRVEVTITPQ